VKALTNHTGSHNKPHLQSLPEEHTGFILYKTKPVASENGEFYQRAPRLNALSLLMTGWFVFLRSKPANLPTEEQISPNNQKLRMV
jgi:hypothetical protein